MSEKEINININITIAEYCGWRDIKEINYQINSGIDDIDGPFQTPLGIDPESDIDEDYEFIPNYCNDLNLMHEVERLLDDDQWLEYMLNLQDVLQRDPNRGKWIVCQDNMHSTAAQRARAFVRTIGKWKE